MANFKDQILTIKQLKLKTFLGVYDHEQVYQIFVNVSIQIKFKKNDTIFSDNIQNSLCYDSLCKKLFDLFLYERTKTIENLTYKIHQKIRNEVCCVKQLIEEQQITNEDFLLNIYIEKDVKIENVYQPITFTLNEF